MDGLGQLHAADGMEGQVLVAREGDDEEALLSSSRAETPRSFADEGRRPQQNLRMWLLGSLVLFVLALLTSRPMLKAEAEEAEHALDLWDEEIIKQQHSKEKSSCGYYGCQQSRGVCSCHHGCIMEGTCCADYRELCQVSDRAHAKSGPGASRGRCAELGCSRAYRYDQPCQCVPSCLDFDDCCDDFRSHCGANVSMSLEVAPSKDEEPKIKASFIPSAAVSADSKEKHKAFLKNHAARLELVKWQAVRSCPPQFMEKTILGGKQMQKLANISTAAECQKVCTLNVQCDGFVWAMNGACSLESLDGAAPNMMVQEGLISGLPCCRPKPAHTKVIPDCPELVLDMELSRAQGLREQEAKSAYACQQACSKATDCGAFSWTATTKRCSMKKLASDESAKMVPKAGVITGLPCGCRATVANALWPDSDEEKFTMPLPRGSQPVELGSLLCLALMLPYSYEAGLLIMQYKEHAGIFDCDEYTVYSSESMVLAPGLETRKVLTSQQCEVGGEFKSALNLRIFASFWRQVIADGQYLLYNWIVKVDPDSVFFPQRLRPILQRHEGGSMSTGGPGTYFNNCKFGMHGPLEVFSLATIRALGTSFLGCFKFFQKLCKGDCQWGEDMWVDQCLKRFVKARRLFEKNLLLEDHCDPPKGWKDCSDPRRVAFHPFKTVTDHRVCMESAHLASLEA